MGYLKTILTYHLPSEAEVDKAFLESRGFNVCLLNGNTARNELGAPFFIQLQVMEEDYARATAILREANPARFGSHERVADIDRQIKRAVFFYVLGAVPAGVAAFFLYPQPLEMLRLHERTRADGRLIAVIGVAMLGGYLALRLSRRCKTRAGTRA